MLSGRAFVLGDDISADGISPTPAFSDNPEEIIRSCGIADASELKGRIIIAGRNFGWGSYRESAALCLKYSGVVAVIARSFGYGMYRNLINLGIPALVGHVMVEKGDVVSIDLAGKKAYIGDRGFEIEISERAIRILEHGGLMNVP